MHKIGLIFISFLLSVSALKGQTYESYLESAMQKSEERNFTEAVAFCTKAIALDSTLEKAYFYRAGFHVAMIARQNASADYENYKNAVADYSKVLELNDSHFESLFFRGGAHSNMGFLEMAIEDYELSISIKEDQPGVHNSLAVAYARTRRPEKGLIHINRATELDPTYAKAYSNKGNIHDMMRQTASACENWKKAIDLGYNGGVNRYNAKCK